ncbi:hypothetical protein M408DRAFT_330774 [Serendipita vermifera MAFF 305830]|uniref:SAC domain-containing protein n=1 Tax=Serendipita vermifera MAFF 305830 TaxID=933852 RepID=A0A0C3AN28_SERVB|nr:hypothetical protein M408DRAFT_330774 [Serendipita vermifera MAFF 305830]
MKRLLNFSSTSKKRGQIEPALNTSSLPKASPSRGDTSPTTSRRPTARKASEPSQLLDLIAAPDALVIRPRPDSAHHLRVAWSKTPTVSEVKGDLSDLAWESNSIQIHGIVGLVSLFSGSYILVITGIADLGNLCSPSRQVYGVTDVLYIPLDYDGAKASLERYINRIRKPVVKQAVRESMQPGDGDSLHVKWQHLPTITPDASSILSSSPSSSGYSTPTTSGVSIGPLANTLADRLSFWKTRRGLDANEASLIASKTTGDHETLGEMLDDIDSGDTASLAPNQAIEDIVTAAVPEPRTSEERYQAVELKVLKEIVRQFTKGGMYFSYTFDLSNSLQRKQQQVERLKKQENILADLNALGDWAKLEPCEGAKPFMEPSPNLPLWQRIDRKFWWNEHLLQPLIESRCHMYILPILQGHFQLTKFHIPTSGELDTPRVGEGEKEEIEVEYVIISRRSRDRGGLRYQRRGIDDKGFVANFVETETIVRLERQETENVFSFVQTRGSIPLFWVQSGYGLKPPPLLDTTRTAEQNMSALKLHFAAVTQRYGTNTCINLAEQHGREGVITDAYRGGMQEANLSDAKYLEWDFHAECRGMRYENISKLTRQLERTFEQQGFYWISGSTTMSQQRGVFRVNCIDCLDRTNVVQSALARIVLESQLETLALLNHPHDGHTQADAVFNDVWANNGDAISRAYAGTSALKGDFTRTGKRDLTGMLNDGINSLARVYTSTFGDWFSQAVIDFLLGNRGLSVFTEFLQNLSSSDPRDALRLSKVREAAIENATAMVVLGDERTVASWTLLSPAEYNVRLSDYFEEKILILTAKAMYIVSYDYSLEKVKKSTRVPLGDILGVQKGAYILSTLNNQTRDPRFNYGMQISFLATRQDTRVTSYSIRNQYVPDGANVHLSSVNMNSKNGTTLSRILSNTTTGNEAVSVAFKSLPVDPQTGAGDDHSSEPLTPQDSINRIIELLVKLCDHFGTVDRGFVSEKDVVSLVEAQKSTTLFSKFEYNFKRLLWLGG